MKHGPSTRTIVASAFAGVAFAVAGAALADQPPGQLGYEGQPGNQGGASGQPASGLQGYEGQPGNQGGR
jgi:Spy/CpxP family protein refolding chaperone